MSELMHDYRLYRAAQQAAQREAKSLLKALRRAHAEKQKARRRQVRRRIELGEAVLSAGCGDWPTLEVLGALLDAVQRHGQSPTQRLALKHRAEAHLQRGDKPGSAARDGVADGPAIEAEAPAEFGPD